MILYHGSRSGLDGPIRPDSRRYCDFGSGFYMGPDQRDALSLICGYENPRLYTLSLDLSNLNVVSFQTDLDWALFIAYNRGKLDPIKSSSLYERISHLAAAPMSSPARSPTTGCSSFSTASSRAS